MFLRPAGVLVVLSLVAASSCGSDEDDDGTETDAPPTTETDEPGDTDDTDVDGPARLYFSQDSLDCDAPSIRYVDVGTNDTVEVLATGGPDSFVDLVVDADAGWIYFVLGGSSPDDDTVERVRVDGTGRETLASYGTTDPLRPDALALDTSSTALFWVEDTYCSPCGDESCSACPGIVRSDRTGAAPTWV